MKVLLYLNRKKGNRKEECPIYVRLTIQGQRSEFSSGIFTHPKFWNPDSHTIMNAKDPSTEAYNTQLTHLKADLMSVKISLEQQGKKITPEMVRDFMRMKDEPEKVQLTLENLIQLFIVEKEKTVNNGFTIQTLLRYAGKLKLVTEYAESIVSVKIPANAVSEAFGKDFILWMKQKGYHPNTIYKTLQVFSSVMKFGVMKKLVDRNELANIKLKYILPDKIETITENQRRHLESFASINTRVNEAKDLFLLQCWTGVEYADLEQLKDKNNFYEHNGAWWIDFYRHKTKVRAILPLFPKAKEILERTNYNFVVQPNASYNSNLKVLAGVLDWSINLVTNTGRKSFGQHRVNEGYSLDAVARMMGHSSPKITQQYYARVGPERIMQEALALKIDYSVPLYQ